MWWNFFVVMNWMLLTTSSRRLCVQDKEINARKTKTETGKVFLEQNLKIFWYFFQNFWKTKIKTLVLSSFSLLLHLHDIFLCHHKKTDIKSDGEICRRLEKSNFNFNVFHHTTSISQRQNFSHISTHVALTSSHKEIRKKTLKTRKSKAKCSEISFFSLTFRSVKMQLRLLWAFWLLFVIAMKVNCRKVRRSIATFRNLSINGNFFPSTSSWRAHCHWAHRPCSFR